MCSSYPWPPVNQKYEMPCDIMHVSLPHLHLPAVNLFLVSCYGFSSFITCSRIWYVFCFVSFRWSLQLRHNVSITQSDPKVHHILPCSPSHPNVHTSGRDPFSFLRAIVIALTFLKSGRDPFPLVPKIKTMWGSLAKFNRDLIFYCFGGMP